MPARTSPRSLDDFPFRTFDKVRYGDTDRQGHVNNAVFSTFLETGRVEFLYNPDNQLLDDSTSFVIARLDLYFVGEINWPVRVDIGTGVTKVGNSSLTLEQAVFQDGELVGSAETVIVQMNDETRKSHPLSGHSKSFLKRYLLT